MLADRTRHPFNLERLIEYSRALVSALPEATVLVVDSDETVWVGEGELLESRGHRAGAISGRRLEEILSPATRDMLIARYRAALAGESQSFDYRTVDGHRLCWIQLTPVYFGEPAPTGIIAVLQDVTQRQSLTAELHSERERRQVAEEMAGLGYWEVDIDTGRVAMSEGALRLLGARQPRETSLAGLLAHFDAPDRPHLVAALGQASDHGVGEYECDLQALDGVRRRLLMRGTRSVAADGRAVIAGTSFDITRLRAAEEARGESEALFRQGFDNSPIGMVLTEPASGRYLQVNDAFCRLLDRGRDELLELSLNDVTHPDDAVADEAARAELAAGAVAHYECERRHLRPDGSLVWTSAHTVPVYHGHRIRGFFCQLVDLTARKEREEQLMRDAGDLERLEQTRSALADDRLVLHAQPIVALCSGVIVGRELLVRLRDEEGRLVPPSEFLPVAERYGSIREIDQWVTQRAVELAAAGDPVEVNLSAASVGDDEMLESIREALERTGADPALVVFEVTETALMADVDRGRVFATAVRALGCRFALDDFGTGYGTFTYLKHIPIDYLKIDIEFVRDLLNSQDDERLVRAIVAMARDLGKTTIAEGVEDAATLERLRELGVDQAQGYHIGRPAEIHLPGRSADSHVPGRAADIHLPGGPADIHLPGGPADIHLPGGPADIPVPAGAPWPGRSAQPARVGD